MDNQHQYEVSRQSLQAPEPTSQANNNHPNWLKRALDGVMVGLTVVSLEGYLLDLLKNVTVDDLYVQIKEGKMLQIGTEHIEAAKKLYGKLSYALDTYNADNILAKLHQKRPDLHSLITTHPEGKTWIEANLVELKKQLSQP